MIDYWESLGRLAYSKDLFSEFVKILPPAKEYPWVTATGKDGRVATSLNIPADVYKCIQDFLRPILTEQFVPTFVAGELAWTFSYKDTRSAFEKIHDLVSRSQPELHDPSTSYFIALGAILVDRKFREEVKESYENRIRLLPRLSDPQRDEIGNLTNDQDFCNAVDGFEDIWDEGCFDTTIYSDGYVQQLAVKYQATGQTTSPVGTYASASAGPVRG